MYFSSERQHYYLFPVVTPSSDVFELSLFTLERLGLFTFRKWRENLNLNLNWIWRFLKCFFLNIWVPPATWQRYQVVSFWEITIQGGAFFFVFRFCKKSRRKMQLWIVEHFFHHKKVPVVLFNIVFWSALRIMSFSVRHRSHAWPPLEKACTLALIDHFTS